MLLRDGSSINAAAECNTQLSIGYGNLGVQSNV